MTIEETWDAPKSFPAAECGAGAACATPLDNACRLSLPLKGGEHSVP